MKVCYLYTCGKSKDIAQDADSMMKHKLEYSCRLCEYITTKGDHFKNHISIKHYSCDECKFVALESASLKHHV